MRVLVLLVLMCPALSFGAHFLYGNELLADCESDSALSKEHCLGYIVGVHDGSNLITSRMNKDLNYCLSSNVTTDQIKKIVVKYLKDYPERLHWKASNLVHNALSEAFGVIKKEDGLWYCPE